MNGLSNILQYCYVFELRSFDNGTNMRFNSGPHMRRYQSTDPPTASFTQFLFRSSNLTQFVGSEVKTPNQNSVSQYLITHKSMSQNGAHLKLEG